MIITEPTPESPSKPGESSPLAGQEPPHPPPAYVQNQPFLPYFNPRPQYRRSPTRRFSEAFLIAVVITILLSAFTSSVAWISKDKAHRAGADMISANTRDGPVPSDGPVQRCVEGDYWSQSNPPEASNYPHSARTVFDLPVSSDVLYLLARGSLAHGSATIIDSKEGGDMVKVEVVVSYYTQEALDRAKVCSLQRRSGENGVGIFTPKRWERHSKENHLHFDIVVRLPVQHSHLVVKAFETELPLFVQTVGDIASTVEFLRLSLMGSNSPITVTSLHAHHAKLATSNSPIKGSFNTSTSLELRTSNAPITANVGLLNNPASKRETGLIIATNNGHIDSSISLTSSMTTKGTFSVNATTSNQPLKLKYDTSPLDSILYSRAHTSNSPATVNHHSAFEGSIFLQSTLFPPSVDKQDVEDPSGQSRHRSLEVVKVVGGAVAGVVYWGEKQQATGYTEIVTTNSPVYLQV